MKYFERERIIKRHLLKKTYRLLNTKSRDIIYNHAGINVLNGNYIPREEILNPVPLALAERKLAQLMDESGEFPNGYKKPYYGNLKISYGYNKVIGYISINNKVRTRIDYDPDKGYHFNFEDSRIKPAKKICIPISDMNEKGYEHYIDMLTRKYESNNIYSYNFKQNADLICSLKSLHSYDFLSQVDPNENIKSDTFNLIYSVEELIQDNKLKEGHRELLNNYLNQDGYNANITRFKSYIKRNNILIKPEKARQYHDRKK